MGSDDTPAGCELDDLIATRVMGWRRGINNTALWYFNAPGEKYAGHHVGSDWQPSRDIGDAWLVVEHLRTLGMCGGVQVEEGPTKEPAPDGPTAYCASFFGTHKSDAAGYLSHETNREAYADTAPLAICRAALAAMLR